MNLAQLIYNLPIEDKRKIRTLEKLRKKEVNTRYSELFNKTCLNENLLPTYTNVRTHDPAARTEDITLEFRRKLIQRQIDLNQDQLANVTDKLSEAWTDFNQLQLDEALKQAIKTALEDNAAHTERVTKNRIAKKLGRLYGGPLTLPEHKDGYINLSDLNLTEKQKEVLNLGLNCHMQGRYDKIDKKVELETLYN